MFENIGEDEAKARYDKLIAEGMSKDDAFTEVYSQECNEDDDSSNGAYYVPFAFQMYGRIRVDKADATNVSEAMEKAEEVLEKMGVADMVALADYLEDSEEIDYDGVVIDEDGNTVDE